MEQEILDREEELAPQPEAEQAEVRESVPRPVWQRVLAWAALAVFVAFLFMYYVNILRSGA